MDSSAVPTAKLKLWKLLKAGMKLHNVVSRKKKNPLLLQDYFKVSKELCECIAARGKEREAWREMESKLATERKNSKLLHSHIKKVREKVTGSRPPM